MESEVTINNALKKYAIFLLNKHLDALAEEIYAKAKELQLPALQLFKGFSEDTIFQLNRKRWTDVLNGFINGNSIELLKQGLEVWKTNPALAPIKEFSPQDAVMGFTIEKLCLLKFLKSYSSDVDSFYAVSTELENHYNEVNRLTFEVYVNYHQNSLRKEKEFVEALIDNSLDEILAFNRELVFTAWNKRLEDSMSMKKEDVIGKAIFDVFPHFKDRAEGVALRTVLNGVSVSFPPVYYQGRGKYLHMFITPLVYQGEIIGGLTMLRDVTETVEREKQLEVTQEKLEQLNKELEEKVASRTTQLETSRQQLSLFMNAVPAFIAYIDKDQRCKYLNNYFETFYQRPVSDALGKLISELYPQDYYVTIKPYIEKALQGEDVYFETELISHIGPRTVQAHYIPYKLATGEVDGYIAMAVDVTEQKVVQQELRKKNEELTRINADLDSFIYTASHDLKAPVSNIEGLVFALAESIKAKAEPEELQLLLELINKSIKRFQLTIKDLTEISKIQKDVQDDWQRIDISELLRTARADIDYMIKESRAVIRTELASKHIRFSVANMRSIFHNLLSNAIKYRDPQRKPEVLVRTEQNDGYMVLSVADNGLGINPAYLPKLFTMFKRFHDHVEGTGIGLYIVKRIMENAGGKIEVQSEPDKGTTFKLYFPVKE